jgi:hypothetical protein
MIKKFTIYGERCSGTNYLESIMTKNFNVQVTWDYGWKHFFGFHDEQLKHSDDVLFICIIRDITDWMNSFFREKHHLPLKYKSELNQQQKIHAFLNEEFFSFDDNNRNRDVSKELMHDRNIYTGKRYKNIFELRHTKIKWMVEDLPKKVKNYIFIKYEDLTTNFDQILHSIKDKGLEIKYSNKFPVNTKYYKKSNFNIYKKKNKNVYFNNEQILNNQNIHLHYETLYYDY